MNQVRLVLWKDMRHLWPQLSLYAILLAAFAWAVPQTWPGNTPNSFLAVLVTMLKILLGLSQFVLITSVVHADRLVGEEQFWITRPYDWRSMLGAKLVFVVSCVALPLALMQWCLLHAAGISPFTAKTAMASAFLRLAVSMWLPLMVIASVTDSLRTAFTFLAAVLVAWAGTLQFILSGTESRMSPPDEFALFGPMFAIVLLTILAYQYARRRTANSCIAMMATLALFLVFTYGVDRQGFGAPVKKLIGSRYDTLSKGGLKLTLETGPVPYEERDKDLQYLQNFVEVKLPIRLEGLPSDSRIEAPNVSVTLAANGIRYAGPWQNASVTEAAIGFPLPRSIFDQVAGIEATLHLELIAEQISPIHVRRVVAADHFPGPMNGSCFLISGKVICRIGYQTWNPTHVEASTTCEGQTPTTIAQAPLLRMKPEGSPDPVVSLSVPLQQPVCAGDRLTFTEYGSAQRFRVLLDVSGVRLQNYRVRE